MKSRNSFMNFSYVAIARVTSAGLQGIFYLALASIVDPEKYGEISYLIAIAVTASIIARFGLPFSVTVYHGKNNLDLVNRLAVVEQSDCTKCEHCIASCPVFALSIEEVNE